MATPPLSSPIGFPYLNNNFGFRNPGFGEGHDGPPYQNHYDLNSKIMLTAIVSLSFVVVLVIILHVYARYILRRQARRRRAVMSSLGLTVHSGEPPKGLDPSVIASLPIYMFKKTDGQDEDSSSSSIECAVCLSYLEDGEMARVLPNCKHTFHAECIDKWLSSQPTCPICRTEAQPRLQPEPREGPTGSGHGEETWKRVNSNLVCPEGTSSDGGNLQCSSAKVISGSSSSRLSSFRRMLSRERSSRRLQTEIQEGGFEDLERQ